MTLGQCTKTLTAPGLKVRPWHLGMTPHCLPAYLDNLLNFTSGITTIPHNIRNSETGMHVAFYRVTSRTLRIKLSGKRPETSLSAITDMQNRHYKYLHVSNANCRCTTLSCEASSGMFISSLLTLWRLKTYIYRVYHDFRA